MRLVLATVVTLGVPACGGGQAVSVAPVTHASSAPASGIADVGVARLPSQAVATLRLIGKGGPYPYRQDGTIFQNREKLLPAEPRGYYREFTVPTPGTGDRGARRIIAGQDGERYYTPDHYQSFLRIEGTP
jgi:ribonuclease T1